MEGVGPRHIRPIKTLGPSILIVPVNVYICLPSALTDRTDRIRHQRVHARCAERARMAGKHHQPDFLHGIVVLLLTVLQCFLTSE